MGTNYMKGTKNSQARRKPGQERDEENKDKLAEPNVHIESKITGS